MNDKLLEKLNKALAAATMSRKNMLICAASLMLVVVTVIMPHFLLPTFRRYPPARAGSPASNKTLTKA